jgi:hypothetical protein
LNGLNLVTEVVASTFSGCTKLKSVGLSWSKLTSIGGSAFASCSNLKETITLSEDCNVSSNAFNNCGLTVYIGYEDN